MKPFGEALFVFLVFSLSYLSKRAHRMFFVIYEQVMVGPVVEGFAALSFSFKIFVTRLVDYKRFLKLCDDSSLKWTHVILAFSLFQGFNGFQ